MSPATRKFLSFVPLLLVFYISKVYGAAKVADANKIPIGAQQHAQQYFSKDAATAQQFFYNHGPSLNAAASRDGGPNSRSLYDYLQHHFNYTNDVISSKLGLSEYVMPTPTLTSAIGNALGVAGLGFLFTKELAVALNTPVLIPFMLVPLGILFGFVLFFPNIGYLIGIN